MLDIKKAEIAGFEATDARKRSPAAEIHTAPMLRGRIVKVDDTPSEQMKLKPEHQWVLNGDRGLSYAETVPEGSKVVAGEWWAADYAASRCVSFEAELAKGARPQARRYRRRSTCSAATSRPASPTCAT